MSNQPCVCGMPAGVICRKPDCAANKTKPMTTPNPFYEASKYFRGLRFVEPTSDSDVNGPHIVDANGAIVAKLFWPGHPVEETAAAEQATYTLGRAMAAALELAKEADEDKARWISARDAWLAEMGAVRHASELHRQIARDEKQRYVDELLRAQEVIAQLKQSEGREE